MQDQKIMNLQLAYGFFFLEVDENINSLTCSSEM